MEDEFLQEQHASRRLLTFLLTSRVLKLAAGRVAGRLLSLHYKILLTLMGHGALYIPTTA